MRGERLHVGCLVCKVPAQVRQPTSALPSRRHHVVLTVDSPPAKWRESPAWEHSQSSQSSTCLEAFLHSYITSHDLRRNGKQRRRLDSHGGECKGAGTYRGRGRRKKGSLQTLPVSRIIRCLLCESGLDIGSKSHGNNPPANWKADENSADSPKSTDPLPA